MSPRAVILITICTLYVVQCTARNQLTTQSIEDLKQYVSHVMQCRGVTGLSLALVKGGETVLTEGFGYRDLATKAPLTERTLVNIGSLTKAFTSTLAADAVARNLITWDEPIKDVFPSGFRLQDEFRTEKASLRDFLSHRLGMPSYWGVTTGVMNFTIMEIAQRLKDFPVLYDFRNKYLYSNYGFVGAAAVVEQATGHDGKWSDMMYSRIFKPLNMTDSRVCSRLIEADWNNIALSNTIIDGKRVQNAEKLLMPLCVEIEPAGGVFTNALDMAKWMNFHLSEGQDATGRQLIPRSILRETHTASMATDQDGLTRNLFPVDYLLVTYGLGWAQGVYNGYSLVTHTGSYSSYTSTLALLPEVDIGVWVDITGSQPGEDELTRDVITMYALDMLLGESPWLNTSTACTFPSPWKPEKEAKTQGVTSPPPTTNNVIVDDYVGEYEHPAFGTFHVTKDGTQLKYSFGRLLRGTLTPKSKDSFYQHLDFPLNYQMVNYFPTYPNGFPLSFSRGNDGAVNSIKIPYMELEMPPVFTRHPRRS